MLAGQLIDRVRLRDGELALFLINGEPLIPTGVQILGAIDAGVTERCDACLPRTAHAIATLANWVGNGRITPEHASSLVNEQNPCPHLGATALNT